MGTDLIECLMALDMNLASLSARESLGTQDLLDGLTQFCVDTFGAAFARIWLIDSSGKILRLTSSRGQYTRLDGSRSTIPVGQGTKIDEVFEEQHPHLTNDVLNDPGVKDKEWAAREGLASFAGFPLFWGGEKLGVLAFYSREALSDEIRPILRIFVALASAIIHQRKQRDRNMDYFCEVTGFKHELLERLIELGQKMGE